MEPDGESRTNKWWLPAVAASRWRKKTRDGLGRDFSVRNERARASEETELAPPILAAGQSQSAPMSLTFEQLMRLNEDASSASSKQQSGAGGTEFEEDSLFQIAEENTVADYAAPQVPKPHAVPICTTQTQESAKTMNSNATSVTHDTCQCKQQCPTCGHWTPALHTELREKLDLVIKLLSARVAAPQESALADAADFALKEMSQIASEAVPAGDQKFAEDAPLSVLSNLESSLPPAGEQDADDNISASMGKDSLSKLTTAGKKGWRGSAAAVTRETLPARLSFSASAPVLSSSYQNAKSSTADGAPSATPTISKPTDTSLDSGPSEALGMLPAVDSDDHAADSVVSSGTGVAGPTKSQESIAHLNHHAQQQARVAKAMRHALRKQKEGRKTVESTEKDHWIEGEGEYSFPFEPASLKRAERSAHDPRQGRLEERRSPHTLAHQDSLGHSAALLPAPLPNFPSTPRSLQLNSFERDEDGWPRYHGTSLQVSNQVLSSPTEQTSVFKPPALRQHTKTNTPSPPVSAGHVHLSSSFDWSPGSASGTGDQELQDTARRTAEAEQEQRLMQYRDKDAGRREQEYRNNVSTLSPQVLQKADHPMRRSFETAPYREVHRLSQPPVSPPQEVRAVLRPENYLSPPKLLRPSSMPFESSGPSLTKSNSNLSQPKTPRAVASERRRKRNKEHSGGVEQREIAGVDFIIHEVKQGREDSRVAPHSPPALAEIGIARRTPGAPAVALGWGSSPSSSALHLSGFDLGVDTNTPIGMA